LRDRIPLAEIEKWRDKLKGELKKSEILDKNGEELYKNIEAYIYDTDHFIKEKDYVKAWEVISFAWGLFEAGLELGVFKK
jgi:hypothetical protein